jgi:outer membrane protein assembly factor BamB
LRHRHRIPPTTFLLAVCFCCSFLASAQDDSGWHISPVQINVRVHQSRPLQLLDDSGTELHGGKWYVDNPDVGEIREEDGHVALWPKAEGTVVVTAALDGEMRRREIRIWRAGSKLSGLVEWSTKPIGREMEDLPAVPTEDGPDLFSLEQDSRGTYIRAFTHDGLQLWLWALPETVQDVSFLCSDNRGGAIVSASHGDSYNLYVVGKDGKLRWRHTFAGVRKGYALDSQSLLHLLNESSDGTMSSLDVWDETAGVQRFNLKIPPSHERELNLRRSGDSLVCASGRAESHDLRTITSRLFVNTDGDAYAAFTQNEWNIEADKCTTGALLDPREVYFSRGDKLVLWRIHPDGSYKSTVVDGESANRAAFSSPVTVMSPTGNIIPDGMGGVLLSVRSTHTDIPQKVRGATDEFVYRITENGELAYKFPLPKYSGPLHDEMVLGENDAGFVTRGSVLVAFDVKDGREMWHWDSGGPEVKIRMATAGGGCVVDTPEGLLLIENGTKMRRVGPAGSTIYSPTQILHPAH